MNDQEDAVEQQEVSVPVTATYDAVADAAYLYLRKLSPGERVRAKVLSEEGGIAVDFDAKGRVTGIEVLGASRVLPKGLLKVMGCLVDLMESAAEDQTKEPS